MRPLKDIYEQAIWANPQTRPVLIARQQQKLADDNAKAAAEAAAKAKKSGASNVRGTNGTPPAKAPEPLTEDRMRAEMAEAYDRLNAA